jgi:outer membrane lipoprotein-sorting protein
MSIRRALCVVTAVGLSIFALPAQDLKLEEILKKADQALGGAEALGRVQSIKLSLKMIMSGGQMEAPMLIWSKRPNLIRTETTVQGKTIVTTWDGDTGWMLNPFTTGEAQKMDAKTASNLLTFDVNGTLGSLAGYRNAGNDVELLGKEDVEGSPAYKVKLTLRTGMTITYFLDAAKFLPIKSIARVSTMGQEMEVENYPSDYKKVGGVLFAHTVEGRVGGKPIMQVRYEKIEINEAIDDSLFKMPVAEKPAEKK